jgi:hypothetical protein
VTAAQAKATFDRAKPFAPEPPRPLRRDPPPADPFPLDALGAVLRAAAEAIVDQVQCPDAIAGQSVLGAATLVVQGHADIELPTGEVRPLSSFFISVAASGERKSTADQIALWPIRKHEKAMREVHEADLLTYGNLLAAWESQRRQILGGKQHKSREAKERALEELGPPPLAPLDPLLTCPEPTFEGLCRLLQRGRPSVGLFSTEGGQFIGGHGMNDENRLKTAAALSGIWDGEPIKRVRAGDGVIIMPGRRVAMHLMVQRVVAGRLLGDPMLADQGMLSRLLVSAPDSKAGTRVWREPKPESGVAVRRYGARLLSILEAPAPTAAGKPNELEPRPLSMFGEARESWIEFANHVEAQIGQNGDLAPVRPLANKLAQHAARLAAVLALVDDLEAPCLSKAHLERGIVLAEHYAAEALRLVQVGAIDHDLGLAEEVLSWLLIAWKNALISLTDLYQLGPARVRDAKTARMAVAILEEHGWLLRQEGGVEINGQRRREAWRIVRGTGS